MIVMMMASTPSLKLSRRLFLIADGGIQPSTRGLCRRIPRPRSG
jgi:hypothetical protein